MPDIYYDSPELVNDALRYVIRRALDMPEGSVRPADQAAPTGALPAVFASVRFTSEEETGLDNDEIGDATPGAEVPPNDVSSAQIGPREAVFSINFYRADAGKFARRLMAAMSLPAALDLLDLAGLSVVRASPVRNLTAIDSAAYEARAQIDVTIRYTAIEASVGPSFNRFPISINNGSTTAENEVTKP